MMLPSFITEFYLVLPSFITEFCSAGLAWLASFGYRVFFVSFVCLFVFCLNQKPFVDGGDGPCVLMDGPWP